MEGEERSIPEVIADLEAGAVLCDRHRKDCFVVREVESEGTRIERDGEHFFVPHSLFAPWVDSRLFPVEEADSEELPEWVRVTDD